MRKLLCYLFGHDWALASDGKCVIYIGLMTCTKCNKIERMGDYK
jgi:hypothetical protein